MTAAVADRGVKFVVTTDVASDIAKPFQLVEAHVAALEKRLKGLTIQAPKIAGANGAASGPAAGAANSDKLARDRERAAERAFRTEAKWNRMAEAAIEKRSKAEAAAARAAERNAKLVADAKIRESKRAEQQLQRDFAAAEKRQKAEALKDQKSDKAFWKDFEKHGEDRAKVKADAERKEAREKQRAHQESLRAAAEQREAQSKLEAGIYSSIHAVGQLGRAFAQFGLIGQENMRRVLDTVFAVEGSINAVQGGVDAFRSIRGLREALAARSAVGAATTIASGATGLAGAGGTAAGGVGLGHAGAAAAGGIGLGTVGLAGAGGLVALAGAAGIAGTIADRNRGVAGNVGGFWDTIGGAINAPVGFINRGLMGVGSKIERSFNASYGLTQFQTEERSLRLHEADFKRDFGADEGKDEHYWTAKKRADLWEERTQLMERRTNAVIDERQAMLDRHEQIDSTVGRLESQKRFADAKLAEDRYGVRATNLQRRGELHGQLLNESFGRQREAVSEQLALRQARALGQYVSPDQAARAAGEAAREEGLTTGHDAARLNNLRLQHMANLQRGQSIGRDLYSARMRLEEAQGPNGSPAGRENAAQEKAAAEERLKQNAEERARLEQEIRRVGIDGAQKQLQLREASLATAKETTVALGKQNQSAKERFGAMLPEQQRSLIEAAKAMQAGHANRLQVEKLRGFSDLFAPELRQVDERNAERGGYDKLLGASSLPGRIADAKADEQREMKLTVDQRAHIAAELHFDASQAASDIARIFTQQLQQAHDDLIKQIDEKIRDANREMARQQREQDRVGAGGE